MLATTFSHVGGETVKGSCCHICSQASDFVGLGKLLTCSVCHATAHPRCEELDEEGLEERLGVHPFTSSNYICLKCRAVDKQITCWLPTSAPCEVQSTITQKKAPNECAFCPCNQRGLPMKPLFDRSGPTGYQLARTKKNPRWVHTTCARHMAVNGLVSECKRSEMKPPPSCSLTGANPSSGRRDLNETIPEPPTHSRNDVVCYVLKESFEHGKAEIAKMQKHRCCLCNVGKKKDDLQVAFKCEKCDKYMHIECAKSLDGRLDFYPGDKEAMIKPQSLLYCPTCAKETEAFSEIEVPTALVKIDEKVVIKAEIHDLHSVVSSVESSCSEQSKSLKDEAPPSAAALDAGSSPDVFETNGPKEPTKHFLSNVEEDETMIDDDDTDDLLSVGAGASTPQAVAEEEMLQEPAEKGSDTVFNQSSQLISSSASPQREEVDDMDLSSSDDDEEETANNIGATAHGDMDLCLSSDDEEEDEESLDAAKAEATSSDEEGPVAHSHFNTRNLSASSFNDDDDDDEDSSVVAEDEEESGSDSSFYKAAVQASLEHPHRERKQPAFFHNSYGVKEEKESVHHSKTQKAPETKGSKKGQASLSKKAKSTTAASDNVLKKPPIVTPTIAKDLKQANASLPDAPDLKKAAGTSSPAKPVVGDRSQMPIRGMAAKFGNAEISRNLRAKGMPERIPKKNTKKRKADESARVDAVAVSSKKKKKASPSKKLMEDRKSKAKSDLPRPEPNSYKDPKPSQKFPFETYTTVEDWNKFLDRDDIRGNFIRRIRTGTAVWRQDPRQCAQDCLWNAYPELKTLDPSIMDLVKAAWKPVRKMLRKEAKNCIERRKELAAARTESI